MTHMTFSWMKLPEDKRCSFKRDMQKAFQYGAEQVFGPIDRVILPEEAIDRALGMEGAAAFIASAGGRMAGGAIVIVDEEKREGELAFLYVLPDCQGKKLGQGIWSMIEETYPAVKIWKTCTPYFEKRNIHFYINCCGFHAVEFYGPHHPEPDWPYADNQPLVSGEEEYSFRLEKRL